MLTTPDAVGRHRRSESPAVRIGRAFDVIARLGTLVTLAALLVLAAAVGAVAEGTPDREGPTVTVTFEGAGP